MEGGRHHNSCLYITDSTIISTIHYRQYNTSVQYIHNYHSFSILLFTTLREVSQCHQYIQVKWPESSLFGSFFGGYCILLFQPCFLEGPTTKKIITQDIITTYTYNSKGNWCQKFPKHHTYNIITLISCMSSIQYSLSHNVNNLSVDKIPIFTQQLNVWATAIIMWQCLVNKWLNSPKSIDKNITIKVTFIMTLLKRFCREWPVSYWTIFLEGS